jgi:hypothetical protein
MTRNTEAQGVPAPRAPGEAGTGCVGDVRTVAAGECSTAAANGTTGMPCRNCDARDAHQPEPGDWLLVWDRALDVHASPVLACAECCLPAPLCRCARR